MRLCPWADVVFGHDGAWWHLKRGLPKFHGTKLTYDTKACTTYHDIHKIDVVDHNHMLFDEPGVIGFGGNSGFEAINIAVQFGVRRILLVGFDMCETNGVHWYGRNVGKNMRNPTIRNYARWRDALNDQSFVLNRMGVEVINTSNESALMCFDKNSIDDTLAAWGI